MSFGVGLSTRRDLDSSSIHYNVSQGQPVFHQTLPQTHMKTKNKPMVLCTYTHIQIYAYMWVSCIGQRVLDHANRSGIILSSMSLAAKDI